MPKPVCAMSRLLTQVKGDSETHPLLSPNDEFADFETMPFRIGAWVESQPDGSYVRQAYLRGLEMINP